MHSVSGISGQGLAPSSESEVDGVGRALEESEPGVWSEALDALDIV